MEGCESLWNEVVRRAVMDAQGKVMQLGMYTKHKSKAYREQTKRMIMSRSLNFLSGGGNWEMACDVIGREHIEYSKEILEGLNGHRRTLKRDAKRRTGGRYERAVTGTQSGQKGNGGKEALSKNMENGVTRKRREGKKHMAPAGSDSAGLRSVPFAGDTGQSFINAAVVTRIIDAADEGMR